MKPKVLWIEDSARLELRNLMGPVYFSGKYDFALAEDVTTAINLLRAKSFDVIIVDIRLPPGVDPYWQDLYKQASADKVRAQLGIRFLRWLLGFDKSIYTPEPPQNISPDQIGIFSVETRGEIHRILSELDIKVYQHKAGGLPDTILLDLIDQIIGKKSTPLKLGE